MINPVTFIWIGAAALANGAAAGLCARSRAYGIYVLSVAVVASVSLLYLCFAIPQYGGVRSIVADVLRILPIPLLFSVIPGLLVRKGVDFARAFAAGFVTTLVAALPFLFYGLMLVCYVGGDCL